MGTKEQKRVSVDFTGEAFEELDKIAEEMNTSKAEAIRRALGLISVAIKEKKEGKSLFVVDKKRKEERELFLLY